MQTLYQIGRTVDVTREFRNYNLDTLGLREVRWTGFGELKTATGESILSETGTEQCLEFLIDG